MTSYTVVPVAPDTPQWEQERRNSIGASDVPNVLNLAGSYGTPLEVYRSKMGVETPFPEMLGWVGHEQESIMHRWVEKFHPELGPLSPGFMARSVEHPWLHASFDRMADGVPVQMKTVGAYKVGDWRDDIPLAVQAQVQAEILVAGTDRAYLVAFLGGRDFTLDTVYREERFLSVMVERCGAFWRDHVLAKNPPEPVMASEATSLWAGDETVLEVDGELAARMNDLHGLHRELTDDRNNVQDKIAAIELELMTAMKDATAIRANGFDLFTWKPKRGARRIDIVTLRKDHPDIAEQYTVEGKPSRTFLRVKGPINE